MSHPPVVELNEAELSSSEAIFAGDIEGNLWVAYHATSSVFEDQIDREGLRWKPSTYAKSDIEQLVSIFDSMDWAGVSGGGLVVLKPFTLHSDFQAKSEKPLYLREISSMSLIYATREFAGGETARAVRHAFADLDLYLEDETVRSKHLAYCQQKAVAYGQNAGVSDAVDTEWLRQSISQLEALRKGCHAVQEAHQYGLIYAVQFRPEDIQHLSYCSSMGVKSYAPILPNRILGKAKLLAGDDVIRRAANGVDCFERHKVLRDSSDGLLSHLKGSSKR